jgi:hypothetical protein
MLLAVMLLAVSGSALAQLRISVRFGPPAIPVYEQPACPGDGYIWTPGYWAWADDAQDYYWVPGTWVMSPEVGYYWTPAWWGWEGGAYLFHAGYWGPHVGFYGGVNYGFGYFGDGYRGGRWDHDHFFYNREVTHVDVVNIHNVYNEHVTIINNSRVSYNGGEGGLSARATHDQEEWMHERHVDAVDSQRQHETEARGNTQLRASVNHGRPAIAATERAGDFHGHVVEAKEAGGAYNAGGRATETKQAYVHAKDLPPVQKMSAPNTGNARQDQRYQQQQDKLAARQDQQRQKLQQRQDNEHAKLQQHNKPAEYQQHVEQKHQQQTQQLADKHTQERENLTAKQSNKKH